MSSTEAQLKVVREALATTVLQNVAHLGAAEVLFGQPVEARAASRRAFPDITPYRGVTARHRGMVGHRHAPLELGTVTAGRCHVLIGDMLYEARAGDWLLVRARLFHGECPAAENEPYASFWFSPRRHFLHMRLHEFHRQRGYCEYLAESVRDMFPPQRSSLSQVVVHPWDSVIETQTKLVEIVDWCLHNLAPWGSSHSRHRNPQVTKAIKLFGQLGRKPTAEQVAEQLGLTPKYLSHLFHRETGMTIRAFVQKMRVDEACRLLGTSGQTIKEVAAHLGYSDTAHFSTAFRRGMGISPSRYRRQYLESMGE